MSKVQITDTPSAGRRQFESLAQAAQRTGLSARTLRRRIAEGRLPAYRNGPRILRVDPEDVDQLMIRVPAVRSEPRFHITHP
ncbi:helix-turn-helix transcriptional regulator [Ornithinimicrobium panacihumi]|uniref:helix-turn-helix transcriptional regulator n=1 Tax=Ornithinimicrobium panacihumi TaxID=2008449 RepID=UPI003F89A9C2